jgi:hypothetical protein
VSAQNDIGEILAELPEYSHRAGHGEGEHITPERGGSSEPVSELVQGYKKEISDGRPAAEVHGEIQRLAIRRLRDDGVEDEHGNRRPRGAAEESDGGGDQSFYFNLRLGTKIHRRQRSERRGGSELASGFRIRNLFRAGQIKIEPADRAILDLFRKKGAANVNLRMIAEQRKKL